MKRFHNIRDDFRARINEILAFINLSEQQKDFILAAQKAETTHLPSDQIATYSTFIEELLLLNNSTVQYNAVIISIYACFENFVDQMISEYADFLIENIDEFNDLPKKMTEKHFERSIEFLSNPQRYKNWGLDTKAVVSELNDCLNNGENFKISTTKQFFIKHSANLTIDEICLLLNSLGIDNFQAYFKSHPLYIAHYSEEHQIPLESAKELAPKSNELFSQITLLVDNRNIVAHSWVIDNRLSFPEIKEKMLSFLDLFSNIFTEIITDFAYTKAFQREPSRFTLLPEIIALYDNGYVLCFNNNGNTVTLNDSLLVVSKKGETYITKVKTIQINKIAVETTSESVDIGIGLSKKVTEGSQIYIYHGQPPQAETDVLTPTN